MKYENKVGLYTSMLNEVCGEFRDLINSLDCKTTDIEQLSLVVNDECVGSKDLDCLRKMVSDEIGYKVAINGVCNIKHETVLAGIKLYNESEIITKIGMLEWKCDMKYKNYEDTLNRIKDVIEMVKKENRYKYIVSLIAFTNPSINSITFEDGSEMSLKEFTDKIASDINLKVELLMFDTVPKEKGVIIVPYVDDRPITFRTDDIEVEVNMDTLEGQIIKQGEN